MVRFVFQLGKENFDDEAVKRSVCEAKIEKFANATIYAIENNHVDCAEANARIAARYGEILRKAE
jgi:hypothetical protein